ncbi:STAS domain-containing protein [Lentzea sp. HUAS TT2]|uniref:STAS domain-containing protein n=1 Tax=Lentzea sp. HUAS TT2 TaxID=3447454 RepID=UPI003F70EA1E
MAHLDVTAPLDSCAAGLLTVTARTTASGPIVVTVRGELEGTTSALLRDRVNESLVRTRHLVLDLGGVSFLCAAGLTALVEIGQRALAGGTGLCVVARTRQVRMPLMITGLTGTFDLHVEVGEAVRCRVGRGSPSPAWPLLAGPRQAGDLR